MATLRPHIKTLVTGRSDPSAIKSNVKGFDTANVLTSPAYILEQQGAFPIDRFEIGDAVTSSIVTAPYSSVVPADENIRFEDYVSAVLEFGATDETTDYNDDFSFEDNVAPSMEWADFNETVPVADTLSMADSVTILRTKTITVAETVTFKGLAISLMSSVTTYYPEENSTLEDTGGWTSIGIDYFPADYVEASYHSETTIF